MAKGDRRYCYDRRTGRNFCTAWSGMVVIHYRTHTVHKTSSREMICCIPIRITWTRTAWTPTSSIFFWDVDDFFAAWDVLHNDPVNSNRKSADEPPPNINLRTHSSGRRCCWNRVALRDSLIFPERNYWELEGDLLATSSAMLTEIPTLERLCQEVLANEAAKYGSKKINELCKRIPSHLLESILQSLLDRNQVTDVALNMFLVPSRTNLVMNGFCKIKNSTFKQIGYSCPNLVRFRLILVRKNLRMSNNIIKF